MATAAGEPSGPLELWRRPQPGSRRPRFSRDELAAAAMRILDAEGFDALSMRRLATEVGAGTMTLYHYVRTKDELLALVGDAIMGELVVPDDELPADDWRTAMTAIAYRMRDVVRQHPWVLEHLGAGGRSIGPNGVRHMDQTMRAVSSLDAPLAARLDVASAVDEYVFGFCLMELEDAREGPADTEMIEYVNGLVASGGYPALADMLAEHGADAAWAQVEAYRQDTQRFDRNLRLLLDGLESDIERGGR